MADYAPIIIRQNARPSKQRSPESRYWRRFKYPSVIKDNAPVTAIHFAPTAPHHYAVTSGTHVQILAPRTHKVTKNISRFKDTARSGNIRKDGKLVIAGDDTGMIQIFDINSRAILRTLNEHKQPVHITKFSPQDSTRLVSCSDDTTVKIWDIPSETPIHTFASHTDYVRAGQISPSNPALILTGSYDATVRLFDTRAGICTMTMGADLARVGPVEDVLMFPSGSLAVAATGNILRVWDLVAGGRCIRALSNHQKSITSMAFNGSSSRLLTGGLDQLVKVYDVATYQVVHTMRYPSPILSLAVSPDDTHIAVGMVDGSLSVRRRQPKPSEAASSGSQTAEAGIYDLFMGGGSFALGSKGATSRPKVRGKGKQPPVGVLDEFRVEQRRQKRLREYDRLLKTFKYAAAFDAVLRKGVPPTTTFSLISELMHRDGLRTALGGRDDVSLEPVLRLLIKHIADPRFGNMCYDISGIVIDMYTSVLGRSPLIDTLFLRLRRKLEQELKFQRELHLLGGALDMVLASAALSI
ncbi:U3 small nucleolar RNA-associated protein [Ceratobasidium theobromae]|uniref:U3 small nucleolar RNA-associated protein n=1 Tax=Ceratobasidium theobromae TaxID=1582974 RepID=A0A5N5QUI1_9AGAM|nr:U3 small nucleolar RNA-associated protein [Ceratobasidium theobromae]